ncbi:MAG: c-type cytochrome [Pseudomonadota bacterium]
MRSPMVLAQLLAMGDGMAVPARLASDQAERGAGLFRPSCGFCHGAEGAGGQGMDLTSSEFFTKNDQGQGLAEFLKTGRPAAKMPPFPDIAAVDAAAIHAFVRSRTSTTAARAAFAPQSILVGNPAAGKTFFEGRGQCKSCHSPKGDFKGIGSRYDAVTLQGRMINPRVVGVGRGTSVPPPPPPHVRITLGKRVVEGALIQVNDFFVTFADSRGQRQTIPRDGDSPRVEIRDPVEFHRQMMLKWQDTDMWNTTAYLASLK